MCQSSISANASRPTNLNACNNLHEQRAGAALLQASAIGTAQFLLWSSAMARGFESKAVESQQEEAQRRRTLRPAMSTEEKDREARRAGLELALAQTQAEMAAACRPAHREMLKLRLDAIQAQIEDL